MATKDQTYEKLYDLQHMMSAYHRKKKKQDGPMADSTRGKGRVLALLKMKDGIATKDMATILDIRVSSLNETLARLEKDGYVERRPSEDDGRIMLVFLTEKGASEEQPQQDLAALIFADFDDEAMDSLNGHLDKMCSALENELGEDWREQQEQSRDRRERIFNDRDGGRGGRGGDRGRGGERGGRGGYGKGPRDRGDRGYGRGDRDRAGKGGYGKGRRDFDGKPRGANKGYSRETYGKGGHGGADYVRYDAHERYPREAEQALCNHNCGSCTRPTCVRRVR